MYIYLVLIWKIFLDTKLIFNMKTNTSTYLNIYVD